MSAIIPTYDLSNLTRLAFSSTTSTSPPILIPPKENPMLRVPPGPTMGVVSRSLPLAGTAWAEGSVARMAGGRYGRTYSSYSPFNPNWERRSVEPVRGEGEYAAR